ncbi:hypothetical protein UPYG_G00153370 [Umbra pygmaea]|uniref:Uncharacterized protein n=1 Tax=Umbra pygmaea TaxID=75934 RepID=A0ABD0WXI7_UMBPY
MAVLHSRLCSANSDRRSWEAAAVNNTSLEKRIDFAHTPQGQTDINRKMAREEEEEMEGGIGRRDLVSTKDITHYISSAVVSTLRNRAT